MKSIFSFILLLAVVNGVSAQSTSRLKTIDLGTSAPKADVLMKDVTGSEISLNRIKNENGLVVIFSCNTCPFVINWEDRYPGLAAVAKKNRLGMVLINSNEAQRDGVDSFEAMRERAKNKRYGAFYVVDKDHEVADAFGARTTPHVFIFDKDMKLVYKGAIDDNNDDAGAVKERWAENAMNNLGAGKAIEPAETRNLGCSIKRKS